MKRIAALVLALFTASVVQARDISSVKQPAFSVGDAWTFACTSTNKGNIDRYDTLHTIERLQGDKMLLSIKNLTANTPVKEIIMTINWGLEQKVNGVMTTVDLATKFPLKIGKTWRIAYTEDNPMPNYKSATVKDNYKVVGWQDVTVPAGTYRSLKIEDNGIWILSEMSRNNLIAHFIHKEIYYVPSIKYWVKALYNEYDVDNTVLGSITMELRDFHAATP